MIALLYLACIAVWLVLAIYLSKWSVRLLKLKWGHTPVRVLFFVVFLVLPVADEIIGRRQFNQLCEREAVVWLSPDWKEVKKATRKSLPQEEVNGTIFRVSKTVVEYSDSITGKTFLRTYHFSTHGGFLLDSLGLGLDTAARFCHPKSSDDVLQQVNISQLMN